ncbi:hypothetical protein TBR22_A42750 [Luteitalea sp. TBR-22]|nr:hypothetical protein TBR22_A42750 [Luteitalea sp. TBR-22]
MDAPGVIANVGDVVVAIGKAASDDLPFVTVGMSEQNLQFHDELLGKGTHTRIVRNTDAGIPRSQHRPHPQ